jgi:hypothetical protein
LFESKKKNSANLFKLIFRQGKIKTPSKKMLTVREKLQCVVNKLNEKGSSQSDIQYLQKLDSDYHKCDISVLEGLLYASNFHRSEKESEYLRVLRHLIFGSQKFV